MDFDDADRMDRVDFGDADRVDFISFLRHGVKMSRNQNRSAILHAEHQPRERKKEEHI